ncbi:uncharacterized protein spi2 isoform X2 [Syngnathus acus]|uniref:uncharacterized protein spi2 isoform X2 n=1 Tax=Syngnathus acus TaxID=161584 RepID=UPI001885AD86|nr:uncharacterized protein spi2 isoform X2 [Syngnathus acus]
MDSYQEAQSDLEVILEFLEEYHRHNTDNATVQQDASAVDDQTREQCWRPSEPPSIPGGPEAVPCETPAASVTTRQLSKQQASAAAGGIYCGCATRRPPHLHTGKPQLQLVQVGRSVFITSSSRCWRTPPWPTACPGCRRPRASSASPPTTKTSWRRCGARGKAISGP